MTRRAWHHHCNVWAVIADLGMIVCPHCGMVSATWTASVGDSLRAIHSQGVHARLCAQPGRQVSARWVRAS